MSNILYLASQSQSRKMLLDLAKIPYEIKKCTIQCKNMTDMAEKIFALLSDESLYHKISENGLNCSKQFTWDECAKKTIEVYNKIVQN